MQAYAIALIACGSVIAVVILLCCVTKAKGRRGKKQNTHPTVTRNVSAPQPAHDIERGEGAQSNGKKDGGMVILAGAGAAVAATAVVVSSSGVGTSGGDGGGYGGGDGSGDGGGGGGGCGGCGGGCGGCGGGCGG